MRLSIQHTTTYRYEDPVSYGLQQLRLTPKSRDFQEVISWDIAIEGAVKELEFDDQHNNRVLLVSQSDDTDSLTITCTGEVQTQDTNGVVGPHGGFAPLWYFLRSTDLTRAGNQTRKLAGGLTSEHDDVIARLHALSDRVHAAIKYETGKTHTATTAEDALSAGHGVCQDHAHVFIAAARSMGIPARYVSGYLLLDDRIDQDASHAWAEAHVPGIGWIGFDPANEVCPDARYVRVATGLDYTEAAPIHGLRMGDKGNDSVEVSIQVQQ